MLLKKIGISRRIGCDNQSGFHKRDNMRNY